MKCVIAIAFLAIALPAAFGAPRPGYLAGPTLLRSADYFDASVIAAPATLAIAPSSITSHSTVIAHPSPAIAYTHAAPVAYAHAPAIAYAHHPAALVAPAARSTVIAGPSGTITETQGLGAVAW